MPLITVHDLLECQQSTNNEWAEADLLGTLVIVVTETEYPKGTLLLRDMITETSFPCKVDYFHPRLLQTDIVIQRWNLIYQTSEDDEIQFDWIEFSTKDAYFINQHTQSALEGCLAADAVLFEVAQNRSIEFHQPQQDLAFEVDQTVHLVGRVQSISALFAVKPDEPAMFFVQLTGAKEEGNREVIVNLMFRGNGCIPYYPMFHVDFLCMFQHLSCQSLESSTQHTALVFSPGKSTCQIIRQAQLDQIPIAPLPNNPRQELPLLAIPNHSKRTRSLSGTITRVFDTMFGLYEMDRQFLLCLYHSPAYSPAQPLRVQTRIRLHHLHRVSIQPKEQAPKSHLLADLLQAPQSHDTLYHYPCLVGCPKTHLEILSFPAHCDLVSLTPSLLDRGQTVSALKCHVYIDSLSRQVSFEQLIRQLEIYATLIAFFPNHPLNQLKEAYDSLVQQIGSDHQQMRKTFGWDWKTQLFCHHTMCLATGLSSSSTLQLIDLETYSSLGSLMLHHQHNANRPKPHVVKLSGASDRFEIDHVYTETMPFVQPGVSLLGQLSLSPDGRLYLLSCDDSSHPPMRILLLPTTYRSQMALGGLYLIRHARLIREDLSYLKVNEEDAKTSRQELWHEYLVCPKPEDLVLLSPALDPSATRLVFQMAQPDLFCAVQCDSVGLELTRIRIQRAYPLQACFDAQGRLYFESRLVAQWAPVIQSSNSTDTEVKECVLILNSKTRGSLFHSLLTVNSQWIVGSTARDGPFAAARKRRPEIVLDGQRHQLYPVVSPSQPHLHTARVVSLSPVSGSTTHAASETTLPPLVVYQVSQLVNPTNVVEPIPDKITLSNGLYEEPVNVEGMVVLKRFVDGFASSSSSPLNDHALQLYRDLSLGTGKPQRKLFVQLRQSNSLDLVDIYLNIHKVHYPQGLVPGATVIFYHLDRKARHAGNRFFCIANESTTIQVIKLDPDRDALLLTSTRQMTTRLLASLLPKDEEDDDDQSVDEDEDTPEGSKGVVRLLCQVNSVINLVLKWECSDCGSIVRNNECYRMCENAHRVFIANAYVQISDGSASANASLDGERLVFRLLQLTQKQIDALKRVILEYGMVAFGGWANTSRITTVDDEGQQLDFTPPDQQQREAMFGYTIEDLVQNAKRVGQFWIYGMIQPVYYEGGSRYNEDDILAHYRLRRVTISDNGSLLRTVERPKLRFKVVEIELADTRLVSYDLLSQL